MRRQDLKFGLEICAQQTVEPQNEVWTKVIGPVELDTHLCEKGHVLCARLDDGEADDEQSKKGDRPSEPEATRTWESALSSVPGKP
jgi:hypothetical protein